VLATPGIEWWTAAALGAVQGVAEFLPISSSGHLALGQAWAGIDPSAGGHTLNVIVHAGTLLAILIVYRDSLASIIKGFFAREPEAVRMTIAVIVATSPLGLALIPAVKNSVIAFESDVRLVGCALLFTAVALGVAHHLSTRGDRATREAVAPIPSPAQALVIGLAQLLAITPGVSRSGTTIAMALVLGLAREPAARFSFLIAIPAILGATLDEALSMDSSSIELAPYGAAFLVSFGVGLLSLRWLLAILGRWGLLPFVPYLLVVGTAAILVA
jgi:undecaprenyl-diphosphatase